VYANSSNGSAKLGGLGEEGLASGEADGLPTGDGDSLRDPDLASKDGAGADEPHALAATSVARQAAAATERSVRAPRFGLGASM
jgi:hypothetical protein